MSGERGFSKKRVQFTGMPLPNRMKDARRNEPGAWYCRDVGLVYVKEGTNPEDESVLLRIAPGIYEKLNKDRCA